MATSKEYLAYIMEQLSGLEGLSHRSMMGEYIIYHKGKLAAYVCDDRLLVKPLPSALALTPSPVLEPPYPGAKDMLLVENVDDAHWLQALFAAMYDELPEPKPKKPKAKSR